MIDSSTLSKPEDTGAMPGAESWAERAAHESTPLVSGERAVFVWRGPTPPALVGDFNFWNQASAPHFEPAGEGVWTCTLTLPEDAYIEYAFVDNGHSLPDPLNPRRVPDGFGHQHSYFHMPAAPAPFLRRPRGVPRGTLTRYVVEAGMWIVGARRTVYLYQPPVDEPCPLLVVYDGNDYRRRARLTAVVDNLIAQGAIAPLALALLDHGRQARVMEYGASDVTLGFVLNHVLPLAQRELNLLDPAAAPGSYGVLGASMGGLMALYTGLRAPHIFGRVLSQSGAFSIRNFPFVIWDLLDAGPRAQLHIWLSVGRYEYLLATNRRMVERLTEAGYDVTYREYNGGHNYPAWRDDLPAALGALFPPQNEG